MSAKTRRKARRQKEKIWSRPPPFPEPAKPDLPPEEPPEDEEPPEEPPYPIVPRPGILEIWIAVMDEKTCDLCRSLHLSVHPQGEGPQPITDTHPNCRCRRERHYI